MKRKAPDTPRDPIDWNKNLVFAIAAHIYVDLLSSVIHEDQQPAGRKCVVASYQEGEKEYIRCTLQAWNYPAALTPHHFLLIERSLAQLPITRDGWYLAYNMWNFAVMADCSGGFEITFKLDKRRCAEELDIIAEHWHKRVRSTTPEDQARQRQITEVLNAVNSCVYMDGTAAK